MKNIIIFLSEIFHFLVVEFSVYLNRLVFIMKNRQFVVAYQADATKGQLILEQSDNSCNAFCNSLVLSYALTHQAEPFYN